MYRYSPTTGATATVTVTFYKDAAARTAHKQPTAYRSYTATPTETAATFTSAAVTATSNLAVGVTWALTKPDLAGATLATQ